MAGKSPDKIILAGIRQVLNGYKILKKLNPKQDTGFVVKHLSTIFDKNEDESADLEPKREGEETEILANIKVLYNVFKTLCRLEAEEAPGILIQNLEHILPESKEEEMETDPIQSDPGVCQSEENQNQDESIPNIEVERNFESKAMEAAATCSNLESKNNNIETFIPRVETPNPNLNPAPELNLHSIQQQKVPSSSKTGKIRPKIPTRFKTNLTFYCCKFCTRWFTSSSSQQVHQNFCRHSLKSRGKSQSLNSNSSLVSSQVESSVDSHSSSSPLQQEPEPKQVQIQITPINFNLEEKLRKMISSATVTTLTNSGASVSMITCRRNTYKCHLCSDIPIECESLEFLANHLRKSHRPEIPPPFSCLHQGCQLRFSDSSDFRGHVKEPHEKIQQSSEISEPAQAKTALAKNGVETGSKIYKCEYCRRNLSNSTALIRHIRIHTEERPFACLRCPDRFSVKMALDIHKTKKHGQVIKNSASFSAPVFAPAVDELLPSLSKETPMRKTHEEKLPEIGTRKTTSPLKCSSSLAGNDEDEKEGEENEKALLEPELEPEVGPEFEIIAAEVEVETEEEMNLDLDKKSSDSDSIASTSPATAHSKTIPIQHGHSSSSVPPVPKTYKCVECQLTFHNHGHFICHARRHAREESQKNPLTCILCDEEFDNIPNRKRHETLEHSRNGRFHCQVCGCGYLTAVNLLAHSLLHF